MFSEYKIYNVQTHLGWEAGSSGTAPAWQTWGPEVKPQYQQQKQV
jgi:hypothetical protein